MRMSLFDYAGITLGVASIFISQDVLAQVPMASSAPLCKPGYVWREAYVGDVVCVEPRRRDNVRAENALAPKRVKPDGGAYGPDTCVNGYVWRGARSTDHVCVLPVSRDIVARENAGDKQSQSPCGASNGCAGDAQAKQRQINALRQRLAQRQRDLARAKDERRRTIERLREEDERWTREHPGIGVSTQPSIVDNVSPIEQDIRQIEAALKAAELEAAKGQAHAQTQTKAVSRGKQ